jgi:hypothetical protein
MATTLFLTGSAFNLLARGTRSSSPGIASGFSLDDICDGFPSSRVRLASIAEDSYIKVDLQQVLNAGFETWPDTIPDSWTNVSAGSGTVTKETVNIHSGVNAVKLVCGSGLGNLAAIRQTLTVRSGEELTLKVWLKTMPGANGRAGVYNPRTGLYLTSTGSWTKTETSCLLQEGNLDWTENKITFTVESFAAIRSDTTPLVLFFAVADIISTRTVYVDDVELFPSANFLSVHGHNLEPLVTLRWSYSDNDGTYVLIKDLTPGDPTFWGLNTNKVRRRWHKFTVVGTPWTEAPAFGEIVLGQFQTLLEDAQHPSSGGWEWTRAQQQSRSITPTGDVYVRTRTDAPSRALKFPYTHTTEESFQQFREELLERSSYGEFPIVIVPNDDRPEVLFGRIPDDYTDRVGPGLTWHRSQLMIVESPFALSGL